MKVGPFVSLCMMNLLVLESFVTVHCVCFLDKISGTIFMEQSLSLRVLKTGDDSFVLIYC